MSAVTIVTCSQCPTGRYFPRDSRGLSTCDTCGHDIDPSLDFILDAGESLTVTTITENGFTVMRLAIATAPEACECCGSISRAHFTVGTLPCPNDIRDDDDRANLSMAHRAGLERY